MRKDFSPKWISSKQPRKQRKYRYNAPLHLRQKMMSAHLDKVLRREYKRRSVPVREGDEVTVSRGEYRGKKGKVTEVNMKKLKIYIEGVVKKKVSGQESPVAVDPSNVVVTKLKMDDKKRMKFTMRKKHTEKAETKNEKSAVKRTDNK